MNRIQGQGSMVRIQGQGLDVWICIQGQGQDLGFGFNVQCYSQVQGQDLGFRVHVIGFRVQGLEFRHRVSVWDLGFEFMIRFQGLGYQGLGFNGQGLVRIRVQCVEYRVYGQVQGSMGLGKDLGYRVGFWVRVRVWDLGYRVQDYCLGYGVQGIVYSVFVLGIWLGYTIQGLLYQIIVYGYG